MLGFFVVSARLWLALLRAAIFAALVSASPRILAADPTVLVLHNGTFPAEEARLLEALSIYTRDLGCHLLMAGNAPTLLEPATLEPIARLARGEGADAVVWTDRRNDGRPVYYLLSTRDLDLRETEIAPVGPNRAAEAVALKVRTLISRRAAQQKQDKQDKRQQNREEAPPVDVSAHRPPAPLGIAASDGGGNVQNQASPGAPGDTGNSTSENDRRTGIGNSSANLHPPGPTTQPAPRSSARNGDTSVLPSTSSVAELRAKPHVHRVEIGAGYRFALPLDPTWLRYGLTFSGKVRLGRGPFSLFVDAGITSRPATLSQQRLITFRDIPIAMGLQRRWSPSRWWGIVAGPRVGLHVFDVGADVSSDPRSGSARRISAGLGAMAQVEMDIFEYLKLFGGISLEAIVPANDFTFAGQKVLGTGPALLGLIAGIALAIP